MQSQLRLSCDDSDFIARTRPWSPPDKRPSNVEIVEKIEDLKVRLTALDAELVKAESAKYEASNHVDDITRLRGEISGALSELASALCGIALANREHAMKLFGKGQQEQRLMTA